MKKIKLDLDYNFKPNVDLPEDMQTEEKIREASAELSRDYIEFAVIAGNPTGLDSQFRRIYAKIKSKIATAINMKDYILELEDGEYNFIKEAFMNEKTKFTANIAHYVVVLEDELFKVQD